MKKSFLRLMLTEAGILMLGQTTVATPLSALAEKPTTAKYYTAFESEDEAVQAAIDLQRRIAGEGDVLLKNKDNALPLQSKARVSVFGGRQNNVLGASSNSGGTSSGSGGLGLCSALSEYGFQVNPILQKYYQNNGTSIGKEDSTFNGSVKSSLGLYSDAAIVMLSREGGEGSDASRVTSETTDKDDFEHQALYEKDGEHFKHYLMLTNEEEALINFTKNNFEKVIVVINSSNAMEVNSLKNDDQISAIINIGRPGGGGLYGLAQILNGEVSPSGSLVDEWMVDFTNDPTWYNFGNNNQSGQENTYYYEKKMVEGQETYTTTGTAGTSTAHDSEGYHGVDYEEGIYLGYKYYETVYDEIANGNLSYNPTAAIGSRLSKNASKSTDTAANIASANSWWQANVAYAYGYGLSYTNFSFNIEGVYTNEKCSASLSSVANLADKVASSKGKKAEIDKVYVKVTVENTGSVAGKKTVQLYATAPYKTNGVEKASVSLVGFGKSNLLQPGEKEDVIIPVNMQDIASYDYKNLSGAVGTDGGYVLESGDYILRAMDSSHYDYATDKANKTDAYDEARFSLDKSVELGLDDYSGNEVSNLFTDTSIGQGAFAVDGASENSILSDAVTEDKMHDIKFNSVRTADMMADGTSGMTILSRSDMVATFPKAPEKADRTLKNSVLNYFAYWDTFRVSTEYGVDGNGNELKTGTVIKDASHDLETDPWYIKASDIPSNWTQARGVYDERHKVQYNRAEWDCAMWVSEAKDCPIKFADMAGLDYNDPKWDEFLNQLTYDELCTIIEFGGYCTADIQSVGKNKHMDTDGPNNLDGTVAWTSEDILAATFNTDLAYEEGVIMANIGLLHGVQGWYGPGADTHRSPFSGRNNEYYSQDGLHAGYIGAAEVQGVQSMGVIPYIKHCLMNDMETDRGTMFVWADEQTIRESGAKQFQIILQEGQCKAAMTGYARLCGLNNTNNYNLGVQLYQKQWGSQAYFVTDGYIGWRTRTDLDSMVRTGNQMELFTNPFVEYLSGDWMVDENGKGMVYVEDLQSDAKDHLVASPTQWYWVRKSAQSILYQVANSAGQFNGYSTLDIKGDTIAATQGVSVNTSVNIGKDLTDGSSCSYTSSNLPAGLTLNEATGALSGTLTNPGEYNFTVDYRIDGWITKSANYKITVDPAFKLDKDSDDLANLEVGQEVLAVYTSSVYSTPSYDTVVYSVKEGQLPEGLTLTEEGEIKGTPTTPGTYNVTIEVVASKKSESQGSGSNSGGGGEASTTETREQFNVTIVVKGEVAPAEYEENVPYIKDGNWFVNGKDTGVKAVGTDGANGKDGKDGVDGKDGQDAKGCGGSATAATGLGLLGLVGALFLRRRKNSK